MARGVRSASTRHRRHALNGPAVNNGLERTITLIRRNYAEWFGVGLAWVTVLDLIEVRDKGYVVFDSASGETKLFEGEP